MMRRPLLITLILPAAAFLVAAEVVLPDGTAAAGGGSAGGEGFSIAELPAEFNWDKDFEKLPGTQSVNAGTNNGNGNGGYAYVDFPDLVDVALVANCDVLPKALPVDFVLKKIIERFDQNKPGMVDLEPGEVYVTNGDANTPGDFASNPFQVRRGLRNELPYHLSTTEQDEDQNHRHLDMMVCPQCNNHANWRVCVKNRVRQARASNICFISFRLVS